MKTTLGCLRKVDNDFNLIEDGDKIAIGLSGGKDSILLLHALSLYKKFSGKNYSLHAFIISLGYKPLETQKLQELCDSLDIKLTIHDSQLYEIIFNVRKEKSPCALCSKMRRGILCDLAKANNCNKLALGHNRDDAVQTLFMSLIHEGRIHTFAPKAYMSRSDITVIRPLIYLPEKHIERMERQLNMPVQKNACPVDGATVREDMKQLIAKLSLEYPDLQDRVLYALQNFKPDSLWVKPKEENNE